MKRVSKQEDVDVVKFLSECTRESVRNKRELKLVRADQLNIDSSYQRRLSIDKVNNIVKDFCWYLVNPIKVSRREDGTFWIFDGQHTKEAIVKYMKDKSYMVECLVYDDLPYKVENALFTYQTGYSSCLSVRDEFKACEERGVPDVVDVVRALNEAGVPIKNGGTGVGIQRSAWVVPLYNDISDRGEFKRIMRSVYEFDSSVRKEIAWGLWEFKKSYNNLITQDNMDKLLVDLDVDDLRAEASKYHSKMGGAKYKSVTKILVDAYSDMFEVDLPRYRVRK